MSGRIVGSRRHRVVASALAGATAVSLAAVAWAIAARPSTRGAAVAGVGTTAAARGRVSTTTPRAPSSPPASPSSAPTPSPIPGYLMVADAGNHRMLLIDSAKHVLWRYPGPGRTPSFPLGYDDD